ncbi:hypothetical protein AGR8A_Cc60409 [Agrobacterium fabrum str. J-07]|nr:hypothetical protein AGR8A_Cc60409 [Agrobacterium fabrum str. J-07]
MGRRVAKWTNLVNRRKPAIKLRVARVVVMGGRALLPGFDRANYRLVVFIYSGFEQVEKTSEILFLSLEGSFLRQDDVPKLLFKD